MGFHQISLTLCRRRGVWSGASWPLPARAVLKGALGQEDWQFLVEGGSRGLAYRDMAVASTLSTLGMSVRWPAETLREIHGRILRLRGISQRQSNLCMHGQEVRAPVRSFGFEAPPPWRSRACNSGSMASPGEQASPRPSGAAAKKRKMEAPSKDASCEIMACLRPTVLAESNRERPRHGRMS